MRKTGPLTVLGPRFAGDNLFLLFISKFFSPVNRFKYGHVAMISRGKIFKMADI